MKNLLTLNSERYTSHFDIERKLGQCCIQNHCIAVKHELHFAKTCLFLWRPSRYLHNSVYIKRCIFRQISTQREKKNVYFLLHIHVNQTTIENMVVLCIIGRVP